MALSENDVNHVARLARLALSDAERGRYLGQLGRILDHIAVLSKYDTQNVPATTHVVPLSKVWRDDVAIPFSDTLSILANAPDHEEVYFKVKKVIE